MSLTIDVENGSQSLYRVLYEVDGDKYLIPHMEYPKIKAEYDRILEEQDDDLSGQIEDLLGGYDILEGQDTFVMLCHEVKSITS